MLIKWITCGVTDRKAFDRGQRTWTALRDVPGFLGQGGGWSRRRPNLAHVFGCWDDRASYQAFMTRTHDQVAAAQTGTYDGIGTRVFERLLDIGEPFRADFTDATLLRLAHCQVKPGRPEHFIMAQAKVWNPGMASAAGMRRGVFARDGESDFLVLSMWRSSTDHERYLNERFASLRRRAAAADDLDGITGDQIDVEQMWSVPAKR
jgi:heme-degrading monooxygenase HmoA